jgi:hypothetical protein
MTGGEERDCQAGLMGWAQDARARSAAYVAQAVRAAESAAAIGELVDRMIKRAAERNPECAESLQAIVVAAADQRAAIAELKRSFAAGRTGGQLLLRARSAPGAAVITEVEGPLRGMAIVQDGNRIVGEFPDKVVERVFTAGLTLQDAADLTTEPEVRWRIEAAADYLDELIRVIRGTLFSPGDRSLSREPDNGSDDITSPAGDCLHRGGLRGPA